MMVSVNEKNFVSRQKMYQKRFEVSEMLFFYKLNSSQTCSV